MRAQLSWISHSLTLTQGQSHHHHFQGFLKGDLFTFFRLCRRAFPTLKCRDLDDFRRSPDSGNNIRSADFHKGFSTRNSNHLCHRFPDS